MSDQTPENGFHISDIAAGCSLLTRLPVPVDHELAAIRAAAAAWTYPIVGATLGAIAATVAGFSLWLAAPTGLAAALALAVLVLPTGAMHEDGLAVPKPSTVCEYVEAWAIHGALSLAAAIA